jgi:tetratricopeptide (TPR) repeat protein
MTLQEIKTHIQHITEALEQKRLKKAFDSLSFLLSNLQNWQLKEKLSELEDNYKMMLHYLTGDVQDPQQDAIYKALLRSVYQLADQVILQVKTAHSWSFFYDNRKTLSFYVPENSAQLVEISDNLIDKINLVHLLEENDEKKNSLQSLEKEKAVLEAKVFKKVWVGEIWKDEEQVIWSNCLNNPLYPDSLLCLLITAILLSLEETFDEKKVKTLLDICDNENEELRQRALTGLILLLRRYENRLYLYPDILDKLNLLSGNKQFTNDIRNILLQFILSRETEKITRIMTEEIIPGMVKISPKLNNKILIEDILSETGIDEKNPEWQNLIEETGLGERLQEFTELQLEGADIMHSSFGQMKNFPFFKEIQNWFALFSPQTQYTDDAELSNFMKALLESSMLCNSDKYSLCFSVMQMPESYKKMITHQFMAETSAIQEMLKEELPNSSQKVHPIARQYIQDLYRFYKAHPNRADFADIFEIKPEFYQVSYISRFASEPESKTIIGEYYFNRNYFKEAALIFEELLSENPGNETLLQKKGYCFQMLDNLEAATEDYLKAELINANNSWTIKKLAYCYRSLKQPDKALIYYRKAEQLHPNNLSIQLNIGHCYLELKKYAEALKYYFKVEYLSDKKEKALRPIAWCSFLSGKYKEAMDYYRKILENNPDNGDYLNAAHTALALDNKKEAISLYQSAIRLQDNSYEKFLEMFSADIPDLLNAGVKKEIIPLILDSLVYGL